MENDATNDITYFIKLRESDERLLGYIRHWDHLKIAYEKESIWVRGFSIQEVESLEVRTLPWIERFKVLNGKLIPLHDELPDRNEPSALWTPIKIALKLQLPPENFNYFGNLEALQLRVEPSTEIQPEALTKIETNVFSSYIIKAPKTRFASKSYCILNEQYALVLGQRPLSLPGVSYWRCDDLFIPIGYKINYSDFTKDLVSQIDPDQTKYIVLDKNSSYTIINKSEFRPISRSSVRNTFAKYQLN